MVDFTLLVAVDDIHLNELVMSWKTWIYYKHEIQNCPIVVMYDVDQLSDKDKRFNIFAGRKCELIPWISNSFYNGQREKMLTSLVAAPAEYIKTPWYLKLDTDTFATNNETWVDGSWFNVKNVFITNPWGYTKPANAIEILDDWGDNVDVLKNNPRLELHPQPGSEIVSHKRIISWVFFGQTEWTKQAAMLCKNTDGSYKLPVPSQDTYLFYIAKRLGNNYKRVRFGHMGWTHTSRKRKMKELSDIL